MSLPGGQSVKKCLVDIFRERASWREGQLRVGYLEKSAEIIVPTGNEQR